jgi:hypothetical protein
VLDVDPRHGGDDALTELERQHGALPDTARVSTGGRGTHVYFAPDARFTTSRGGLPVGLDVRGHGGYVILPPSIHPNGRTYQWEIGARPADVAFAPAPQWLLERVHGSRTNGVARPPDEWAALIHGPIATGERNDTIARLAGYLLRRRPDPRVVFELVRAVNQARCTPPLSDEEVLRTVDSIARCEAERTQQC